MSVYSAVMRFPLNYRVRHAANSKINPSPQFSSVIKGHVSGMQAVAPFSPQTPYLPFRSSTPERSADKAKNLPQSCLPGLLAEK